MVIKISDVPDVDRWFRRAAILVSRCERNWQEYKVPVVTLLTPLLLLAGILYSLPVSLASGDQDGGPSNSMIDIFNLTEK